MTNLTHHFSKFCNGTLPSTRFQLMVQTEANRGLGTPTTYIYSYIRNPECVTIAWVLAYSLMSRLIIINQDLPCILQEVARFVVLQWHDNQPTYLDKSCMDNRKACFRRMCINQKRFYITCRVSYSRHS